MNSDWRPTPKLVAGLLGGLFLAVLAFSQVAASIGLAINGFRPLGGSFFSLRASQTEAAMALYEQKRRIAPRSVREVGRVALSHAPLSPRSLWLIGKGMEADGRVKEARRAMLQAERVSRRDGAVQLWLGADRLRSGEIAKGLRHFDLLIRANQETAETVMPRLALIFMAPEGRRHLAPYIRDDNPWLLNLFQTAVTELPRAAPVAQSLINRGRRAPDTPGMRDVYRALVDKLVQQRSYTQALGVYPLLPGANPASLRDVNGAISGRLDEGYPPFIWQFPDSNAQGGAFVAGDGGQTLMDVFGASGAVGKAASKLVAPQGRTALRWQVADRSGNLQSRANWVATCLQGEGAGLVQRSTNLLASNVPLNRALEMKLPANCELLRLDLEIAGGIGRAPSTLLVSGLTLTGRPAIER